MTTGTKTIVKEIIHVEYTFSFAAFTCRDVKDTKIRHGGKVSCIVSGCVNTTHSLSKADLLVPCESEAQRFCPYTKSSELINANPSRFAL